MGSVMLNTGVVVVLSLVNIGSDVALGALLTTTAVAIASSYFLPICPLIRKSKKEHTKFGSFKLGRWGIPIKLFSLCFLAYVNDFRRADLYSCTVVGDAGVVYDG